MVMQQAVQGRRFVTLEIKQERITATPAMY